MRVECVQFASPGASGNFNITSSVWNGNDYIGAFFQNVANLSNNSSTASCRWGFGATDLNNSIGVSWGAAADGAAGTSTGAILSTSKCLFTTNGSGGKVDPQGAWSGSTISNGVQLNLSSDTVANRLITAALLSGTDTVMKVGTQTFNTTDTTKTITHGLGGTPDWLIVFGVFGTSTSEAQGTGFSFGFWDRVTTNQSGMAFASVSAANPTQEAGIVLDSKVGAVINAAATAVSSNVTVGSVGATTFAINFDAASGVNTLWGWVAARGATNPMFTKNILTTSPAASGIATLISGMTGRPQAYIALPTRMPTKNALQFGATNGDNAGSIGVSISATSDYTTTSNNCNATTFKNNVASSVAKFRVSNTLGILTDDNTGAADIQGTVSSWNTDGVSINFTNPGSNTYYVPALAFGGTITSPAYVYRKKFRTTFPVYYHKQ